MQQKGLVSVITPCYNGKNYLARFLDSILNQTYPHVELFVINDGSTDNTETIALSYQNAFEQKGYQYTYIKQENGGQARAVNKALKLFSGEYLTWPDSDDELTPDALAAKVEFMQQHPECGGVMCGIQSREDATGAVLENFTRMQPDEDQKDLFWDFFWEKNVVWCPGAYFLRSSAFLEVNPSRDIYEGSEGQNYQILLPVMYHYRFGYIDKCLYYYYFRTNSHSNFQRTPTQLYTRWYNTRLIYQKTLDAMPCAEDERTALNKAVEQKFLLKQLRFASKACKPQWIRQANREAKQSGFSFWARAKAIVLGVLSRIYGGFLKLWRKIKPHR